MSSPPVPGTPTDAAQAALAALRERFLGSTANTVAAFRAFARQLATDPGVPEVLESLRRELHRVHGTAGTYGFSEASRLAAALEERAIRWAAEPTLDVFQRAAIVEHFVDALQRAFGALPDAAPPSPTARRRLALCGLAGELAEGVRAESVLHAHACATLPLDRAAATIAELRPHAVVAGGDAVATLAGPARAAGIPLVAVAPPADMLAGFAGVPGVAVLPAETTPARVLEVVETLTLRAAWAGSTVLVVDDDPLVLDAVRELVAGHGVEVHTLADPAQLRARLDAVTPSLLLMDVDLAGTSGLALTRDLRDLPSYADLPIMLISGRSDAAGREAAYAAGADEFLAKPIVASELRARVTERLEGRRLRRLSSSLHPVTGLPLPERASRAATAVVDDAREAARPFTLVVVRPDGADPAGDAASAWLRETERLANRLAPLGGSVGYHDDVALLAALPTDAAQTTLALLAARGDLPAGAPPWRAGIVGAADATGDVPALRRCADEAVSAARRTEGEVVHRWHAPQSELAPDVVVVEDDLALSELLQYALRVHGFSYRAYASGPAALDALLRMPVGDRRPVVLLDVDLPGMDGHSLHERLRAERPGAFAVVFTTVHGGEGEQVRALKSGALDYVVKPLSVRVLMAKVGLWLDLARRVAA